MAVSSSIEWTEATWNPVTGCSKVSPGCRSCYAEAMATRLKRMGSARYVNGFDVTLHSDLIELPLRWMKPRVIFVNSMSDLFHESVPTEFIADVFEVMARAQHHTFQVLTKRPERAARLAVALPWPENVWMGTSVEDRRRFDRIGFLRSIPAKVRFLSLEPMLESLPALPLDGIQWVIVGGESGRRPRPIAKEWVCDVRDQCERAGVAFFFKQWGGSNKKRAGRELDGRTWDEMPDPRRLLSPQLPFDLEKLRAQ